MSGHHRSRCDVRPGVSGLLTLLAVLLLTACGSSSTSSKSTATGALTPGAATTAKAATGSPIKLGVLADISPNFAPTAADIHLGTDLAVQQINAAGGINGHPLEVIYADPRDDPAQALQLATQLVQRDHVDVLLGAISSAECLGVEGLAPKLGVVYMPSAGCVTDQLTGKFCNKYTFRIWPAGAQPVEALARYIVKTYGTRWAIIYQDYAYGQSQLQTWQAALAKAGGSLTVKITMPFGETNVAPYVTKIPSDGSVDGLLPTLAGTDFTRVLGALQQFGLTKKLAIIGTGTILKEYFGGAYPDELNGAIYLNVEASEPLPGNALDQAFAKAFHDLAQTSAERSFVDLIGGPSKATPGNQTYDAYTTVTALKQAMIAAKFTGRADTEKLITALENLNVPQSADFPAGPMIMSKSDHQGRMTMYMFKINGQHDELLDTIPPEQVPPIGDCKIS